MYGTLAFMRTLPGRRPDLAQYIAGYRSHGEGPLSGLIVSYLYQLDRDDNEAVMFAVFDDRAAYELNSADPQQHERYLRHRELLASDPDWHDGVINPYLAFGERQRETGMYGTVGRLTVRSGAEAEVLGWLDVVDNTAVPGGLGLWLLRPDQEPGIFFIAAIFESKRTYWDNARSPEQDRAYRRLRELLTEDPQWHDGGIVAFQRF
jgi:quinol monooxygenase YgiN